MSKFSDYLASQITPQMTLLEKFNLMIKFLQENNYISVFYSQENYNIQTQSYQKEKVNLNGFTLHIGDCIVFSNGYYAFVETVGVNNFTIGNVLYFQGQQGVSVIGATISSGHLILALSDGENIDAGNLKGINNFSINESQHLIVNYQDGTSQDLGAIFQGNISISGTLTVSGNTTASNISANLVDSTKVTGDEIVEKMTGYSAGLVDGQNGFIINPSYVSACKNGNKITFVFAGTITITDENYDALMYLCGFTIPSSVGSKLYPQTFGNITALDCRKLLLFDTQDNFQYPIEKSGFFQKSSNVQLYARLYMPLLDVGHTYYLRYEVTFLLNDSLID